MNLNGRKVVRFRATIDPMIPPRPRNAFDLRELKGWEFEMTPAGVYVKAVISSDPGKPAQVEEHVIPWGNIQSIKLAPEEKKADEKKGKE